MRVSVPSPNAASLGKFGEIPVNLYTGVPDISIPLFSAKGRTLQVPITMRYNAGGLKVEDIGAWVGMGWTLEAGGVITRTVRGRIDERSNGYYHTAQAFWDPTNWPTPSGPILQSVVQGDVDGEPDQFFFNFVGGSGQFVMGPTSTDPNSQEVRTIPYLKWRIQPFFTGQDISSWVITTEDGTRYTFAAQETHADWSPQARFDEYGTGYAYSSSWYLTQISSPGGDVITFGYQSYHVGHDMGVSSQRYDEGHGDPGCAGDFFGNAISPTYYEITEQRLTSITTATNSIAFIASLRADAMGPSDFPITSYRGVAQEYRLDTMVVKTPDGIVLRRFAFEYDYSIGGRLTLKNIYEQDASPTPVPLPPYSFTYDPTPFPARTSYAVDHWGYYNGHNENTSYIPPGVSPATQVHYDGANRLPDATYARAGVLTRIMYPTGGYDTLSYEGNDYGTLGTGAQLYDDIPRTSSVASSASTGLQSTTFTVVGQTVVANVTLMTYVHTQVSGCSNGDPLQPCPWGEIVGHGKWYAGTPPLQPGAQPNVNTTVILTPGTYTLQTSSAGYNVDISILVQWQDHLTVTRKAAGGLRIAEIDAVDGMSGSNSKEITKYLYWLQGDPTRSSGVMQTEPRYDYYYSGPARITETWAVEGGCSYYSRSSSSKMPLGDGPVVGYTEVEVWQGVNGEFGRTDAQYSTGSDYILPDYLWPYTRRTSYAWMRGQEVLRAESNASEQMQHRSIFTYLFPEPAQTTRKFRGLSVWVASGGISQAWSWSTFIVQSGWRYQDSQLTTACDTTGASCFSNSKQFVYGNPNHAQLTETDETNSDGTQRITRFKYPGDYATGGALGSEAGALAAMQDVSPTGAHMPGVIIERSVSSRVGGTEQIVQAEITTFKEFLTGQFLPYKHYVLNSPSPVQ